AGTAVVAYDDGVVTLRELESAVERLGYSVRRGGAKYGSFERTAGLLLIIIAAYMLLRRFGFADVFNVFPTAEAGMGYGMLFVIGLLTSVHCVAMCGGINLSQSLGGTDGGDGGKLAAWRPGLLYNLGRVASYTIVGGVVGALGAVFTPTGAFRGAVQLIAGAFMIIMGINMLGIFPGLRRLAPRLPRGLSKRLGASADRSNSPLIVGLLNGLMPCGPLQAMQLYALSAGGAAKGAFSMLLFALGTVPLMLGLGALGSALSRRFTRRVMTVGAALVVVLGLSMLSQGWSLTGVSFDLQGGAAVGGPRNIRASDNDVAVAEDGYQSVSSTLQPGSYPAVTVLKGVPVKWTVDAPEGSINGCNNRVIIPKYDLEYKFTTGENVIEFTPTEAGTVRYSCWMGMIRGTITVVEE
ncbi:MAG: sulfite exporter TauE/SafE family protein, partial [Oscillospiraceae bacterium]|nr:sulfite exporter TauE/SafE family protein [Oscillospiraceae bacterium]